MALQAVPGGLFIHSGSYRAARGRFLLRSAQRNHSATPKYAIDVAFGGKADIGGSTPLDQTPPPGPKIARTHAIPRRKLCRNSAYDHRLPLTSQPGRPQERQACR
jgi:hypothetical protein